MSLNILVTGGTGFVGYYIVRRLYESGYQITVLCRKESNRSRELQSLGPRIELVFGSISNYDLLETICQDKEVVVHAAALVSFDYANKKNIFDTNVGGTSHLINAALKGNVKKFIFISSIAAMSHGIDDELYTESIPWNPKSYHSIYALSKYAAEMEVWRGGAEGLQVGILNPSVVLGRWDIGHHSMELIEQMKKNISFYPPGSTGWVDVRDVAESVALYLAKNVTNERIIINGHNASYRLVMQKVSEVFNLKMPLMTLPGRIAKLGAGLWSIVGRWFGINTKINPALIKSLYRNGHYDQSKSLRILGMSYRDLEDTIAWIHQKD